MKSPYVLVVDDDSDIRKIVEVAMRLDGVRVETAENGAVALEKLGGSELPAVILLDLMMPAMDGWAFAEALQKDPRLRSLPVIVMTAVEEGSRPIPRSAGLLRKPMALSSLRAALGKYCGNPN